jgi:hypothetical protein
MYTGNIFYCALIHNRLKQYKPHLLHELGIAAPCVGNLADEKSYVGMPEFLIGLWVPEVCI